MSNDLEHIRRCYQLAELSVEHGNHPFGAVLVINNEPLFHAENTVITENDVTRHAELNLVSAAIRELDAESMQKAVLYTSTEPCAMCAGAIFWAGISKIVYGCSAATLGEIAGGSFVVPCRDLLDYGKRQTEVVGPILEEQGARIHRDFW